MTEDRSATNPLLGEHRAHPGWSRRARSFDDPSHISVSKRSVEACEKLLGKVKVEEDLSVETLSKLYDDLLQYKNRQLQAGLLHYVVSKGATKDLELLLKYSVDPCAVAHYNFQGHTVSMQAVHLAAGLGRCEELRLLLRAKANPNTWTFWETDAGREHFYTPLHDAAWFGQEATLLLLLEKRADLEARNRDGKNAMHLLAQSATERTAGLENMIRHLLPEDKRDALLAMRTNSDVMPRRQANRTPLELALLSGQFPHRMVDILISAESAIQSVLDLAFTTSVRAAEALAERLVKSKENNVRLSAQRDRSVDKMAALLFTAPRAAMVLLDCLTVCPWVADPQHHPIPSRAVMCDRFGLPIPPMQVTVLCDYQPDCVMQTSDSGDGHLRLPAWDYESTFLQAPAWQGHLVPTHALATLASLDEGVMDVGVKAVLLPDMLNLDVLWALARLQPKDHCLFARHAVRGLIYFCWRNIVGPAFQLDLGFRTIELLALIAWAFTARTLGPRPEGDEGLGPSSERRPGWLVFCWAVLLATILKESFDLAAWFQSHLHFKQRDWGRQQVQALDSSAAWRWNSLWSLRSLCSRTTFLPELLLTGLLLVLMVLSPCLHSWHLDYWREDAEQDELLLALNTFFRFLRIIVMSRVSWPLGRKIVSAMNSFCSKTTLEMLATMGLVFVCIWVTFVAVIGQRHPTGWVAVYLFRGMVFGDGDGLEKIGLGPYDSDDGDTEWHHGIMLVFMGTAAGLFNIIILNLIVNPVYGSEYDDIQQDSELSYHKERASYSCKYLMTKLKSQWVYYAVATFCNQFLPDGDVQATSADDPLVPKVAVYAIAGVLLLLGLRLPFDWGNVLTVLLGGVGIWAGEDLLLMMQMRPVIFPGISVNKQGDPTMQPHFLWVCYGTSYDENWCIKNDSINQGNLDAVKEELKALREELGRQRTEAGKVNGHSKNA
eukprot:CAMPEP_0168419302 /NCGR_PEP_ID=MMETSP0228-20121227/32199_1 /TAXON_ID=133427 /ORGANISM="Protoceratium reticulatum, Strain CCCM 535 (=CCMP 1889)" /LENGTH=944 /DNA_ID=CAMNT_0008433181 /DNA_START=11 /DNA_END=2846 /DNA_ORIENTATION=+